MVNTVVITSVTSQGDSLLAVGTVNGVSVSAPISRTVLNSLSTALLAQQYVAFVLLHSAPQSSATQLPILVIPGTVNL